MTHSERPRSERRNVTSRFRRSSMPRVVSNWKQTIASGCGFICRTFSSFRLPPTRGKKLPMLGTACGTEQKRPSPTVAAAAKHRSYVTSPLNTCSPESALFALYVGASDGKADQSERSIKRRLQLGCRERNRIYEATNKLGEDYPFECSVASYVSRAPSRAANVTTDGGVQIHVQWAGDQLILPSIEDPDADAGKAWERWMIQPGKMGAILLACGITGSLLQGANVLDMRPHFVVLDDLDKRDSLAADRKKTTTTETGTVVAKIEDIIEKTIAGMKGQGQKMGQVMLCTVTARRSIAFMYTDPEQKPSWAGQRFKMIKKHPEREDFVG